MRDDHEVDTEYMADRCNSFNCPQHDILGTRGHLNHSNDTPSENLPTQQPDGFCEQLEYSATMHDGHSWAKIVNTDMESGGEWSWKIICRVPKRIELNEN